MSNNKITTYQQNTKTIQCDVSGLTDLVGYTGTLTVKKDVNSTPVITNTGTVNDMVITFTIPFVDTSISTGDYLYDVTIESSINKYTVVQDKFILIDSVRY